MAVWAGRYPAWWWPRRVGNCPDGGVTAPVLAVRIQGALGAGPHLVGVVVAAHRRPAVFLAGAVIASGAWVPMAMRHAGHPRSAQPHLAKRGRD